jgi:hypothetical protein
MVECYADLLDGLSPSGKIELIENLSKSLTSKKKNKEAAFFKSFGAFAPEKTPEEIIKEIKESRKFREKEINF